MNNNDLDPILRYQARKVDSNHLEVLVSEGRQRLDPPLRKWSRR